MNMVQKKQNHQPRLELAAAARWAALYNKRIFNLVFLVNENSQNIIFCMKPKLVKFNQAINVLMMNKNRCRNNNATRGEV